MSILSWSGSNSFILVFSLENYYMLFEWHRYSRNAPLDNQSHIVCSKHGSTFGYVIWTDIFNCGTWGNSSFVCWQIPVGRIRFVISMEQNAIPSSEIVDNATLPNCYSLRPSDVVDWLANVVEMLGEAVDDTGRCHCWNHIRYSNLLKKLSFWQDHVQSQSRID